MLQLFLSPSFHLHTRLLPRPLITRARPMLRPLLQRNRQLRQLRHRPRIPLRKLIPLLPPNPRHQRQVIVRPPPRIAVLKPPANTAMLDGFRISGTGFSLCSPKPERILTRRTLPTRHSPLVIRHFFPRKNSV